DQVVEYFGHPRRHHSCCPPSSFASIEHYRTGEHTTCLLCTGAHPAIPTGTWFAAATIVVAASRRVCRLFTTRSMQFDGLTARVHPTAESSDEQARNAACPCTRSMKPKK